MRLDAAAFTWLLGSLRQLNRVPFDADLALREFPPPHGLPAVLEAMRRLGFEADSRQVRAKRLAKLPIPFVALVEMPMVAGMARSYNNAH